MTPPTSTPVFDAYWHFAAERQKIFFARLQGQPPPWTTDTILANYKFTNTYRASDRVSQYLIRNVIYDGVSRSEEDVLFRILLFKIFNSIPTWEWLTRAFGEIRWPSYRFGAYDAVLSLAMADRSIYSAAYIMPSPSFGYPRKHQNHLRLIEQMMRDRLAMKLSKAKTMEEAFGYLRAYLSIGDFLAYQLVTDINYSELTSFSEMEFVAAGPGALSGIRKCFSDIGKMTPEDVIRWTCDQQGKAFTSRGGLEWRDLFGRPLQLIDAQNIFCETDKHARISFPGIKGIGDRKVIKQKFATKGSLPQPFYPPKWGLICVK